MEEAFTPYGIDIFGNPIKPDPSGALAARFTVPPFSVLDARSGEWQSRKRAWLSLGIESEVGRGMVRPHGKDTRPAEYSGSDRYEGGDCWRGTGRKVDPRAFKIHDWMNEKGGGERVAGPGSIGRQGGLIGGSAFSNEWQERHPDVKAGQGVPASGTSIFDPVLTELAYKWFLPPNGQIVDPFAGGSVRGIVASCLGFRYWGSELRPEQVEANRLQADAILGAEDCAPEWRCADARDALAAAPSADFVFTCPPYGDLEVYSDDPADLSSMEWSDFCVAYREVISKAVSRLKNDRFAAIVVGEFRDPRSGEYRGFVPLTIEAFRDAGCAFYNEAILVTPAGSLPIRAGKQFASGRKLGKSHQQLLVFVKGDWKAAAAACGDI